VGSNPTPSAEAGGEFARLFRFFRVMARKKLQSLLASQHGVVTRAQFLGLGFTSEAIDHRIERGRLFRIHAGVYAVGRPELTRYGRWMAAVLSCGRGAALSHESAAVLWGIRSREGRGIELTAPGYHRRAGITVHRRQLADGEVTRRQGIPVTAPVSTLVDLAARVPRRLEAAVKEADKLDLTDPARLRAEVDALGGRAGVRAIRELLDRRSFTLTDSELERRFLPLACRAGLPAPLTGAWVSGFKVDFYWPDLGLVVETDGLRYHRTPEQQARDRLRDQTHTAAGLTCLRFTWAQVASEPAHVEATLRAVSRRVTISP
jgi:predicted transcriptional regulator of viral defense system